MEPHIERIVRSLKQESASLYGSRLRGVVLFGSHAREDSSPGSDIDVLVVLDGNVDPGEEVRRTGEVVSTLSLRHDVTISCVFVSSERYAHERSPLLMNVRREGIPV
ncbi:nucleotidyltransferase domain-containing protein [Candidatus Poribacteria bacterium]|nr:nucleotidyltransferase domain-containing protein [Candidatus Poribacteria bacterium]